MAEHHPVTGTDSLYVGRVLMIPGVPRIRAKASRTCHGRSTDSWLPSPLPSGYTGRRQESLWGESLSTWEPMPSHLFIVVGHELTEVDSQGLSEPHVGIWWQGREGLVAFAQALDAVEEPMPLIDSDLAHNDLWPHAAGRLGADRTSEYFEIPRGRVLWDSTRDRGIVYHGNATGRETLVQVAALFGLPNWETRKDDHYLMGESLERFYRNG